MRKRGMGVTRRGGAGRAGVARALRHWMLDVAGANLARGLPPPPRENIALRIRALDFRPWGGYFEIFETVIEMRVRISLTRKYAALLFVRKIMGRISRGCILAHKKKKKESTYLDTRANEGC